MKTVRSTKQNKVNTAFFYFLLFPFTFLLSSCNTTGPKPERDVVLKVEDVSSTEAWLKLSLNNFTAAVEVQYS